MIEQKTPPEPDALDRQPRAAAAAVRNRRLGGIALAAVIIAVAVFAVITLQDGDRRRRSRSTRHRLPRSSLSTS